MQGKKSTNHPGRFPGKTIIGVTGGVGSGKSLILSLLKEQYGACILQADLISKSLIKKEGPAYRPVIELLGEEIVGPDGEIDKARMAALIFHDPEKLLAVNAILHPATFAEVLRLTQEAPETLIVYESAIPQEARFPELCDRILYIYAPRRIRLERLRSSRNYSEDRSRSVMRSQPTDKTYRSFCDAVLRNDGTMEEVAEALEQRLAKWGIRKKA